MEVPGFQHIWQPVQGGDYTLIVMHGRGGSMQDFEQLQDIWRLPALNHLLLQGPDPFLMGGAGTTFRLILCRGFSVPVGC